MKRWPTDPVAPRTPGVESVQKLTAVADSKGSLGELRTTFSLGEVAIVRGKVLDVHFGRLCHGDIWCSGGWFLYVLNDVGALAGHGVWEKESVPRSERCYDSLLVPRSASCRDQAFRYEIINEYI
jgi:hypothetical protein